MRILRKNGRFRLVFALHNAARKFLSLKQILSTVKTLIYRVAISLKLPWPAAYLWWGQLLARDLCRLVDSNSWERSKGDQVYLTLSKYLTYAQEFDSHSVEAAIALNEASLITGRISEWLTTTRKLSDKQEERAKKANVEIYNLRIIDADQLFSTLGLALNIDAWVKSGLLGLRPPWRSVVLVEQSVKGRAVNQCLLDYWTQYLEFMEAPDELLRLRPLRDQLSARYSNAIRCSANSVPFAHSSLAWMNREWEEQCRDPLLQLKIEHWERGWANLVHMGVPRNAWFVTIHVREPGFKGSERFRDSDIATYIKAIKRVTDRGGWVIRLGDPSMTPLSPQRNVIDYAHSAKKSDWMDVFLCATARFMIATSSGVACVSHAFGVPIVMTNYLPTATIYLGSRDLLIPRLLRRLDGGSFLTFQELMNPPYNFGVSDGMYRNIFRVEVIPNTSDEIVNLVQEMLDKLDGTLIYTQEDDALQRLFKMASVQWATVLRLPDFNFQYRVGCQFLRTHQNLLLPTAPSEIDSKTS